ncbi:MAG: hypothetical protein WCJ59_02995 [bacterium]
MKNTPAANSLCVFCYDNSAVVSPNEKSRLGCYKSACQLQKKKPCFKHIIAQVKKLAQGAQAYIAKRQLSKSNGLIWVIEIKSFGVATGVEFIGPRYGNVISMLPCTTVITVAESKGTCKENEKLVRNLCRLHPRGRYFRFYGQCYNLYSAREHRFTKKQKGGLDFKMNRGDFIKKVPTTVEAIPLSDEIVRYIFREVFRQRGGAGNVF